MTNIEGEFRKFISDLSHPNIAIIGRTGVGKSSLINAVFGINTAAIGSGLPITQNFVRYPPKEEDSKFPIVLYDSPGYEATRELEWFDDVLQFFNLKEKEGLDSRINLVWYVINASSGRVEFFEIDIIKNILERNIPVIIVLSQCDRAKASEIFALKKIIASFNLKNIESIIGVSASPLEIRGKPICEPFGLEELVDKSTEKLPSDYLDAFIIAQITDLNSKKKLAWKYIAAAASVSFGAGFIPIPGSTPVVAFSTQVVLCSRIAAVYGFKDFAKNLTRIGISSIGTLVNFLSTTSLDFLSGIFPPSSILSGASAGTFITVVGLAYTSVLDKLARTRVFVEDKKTVEEFLKKTFREELRKYSIIQVRSKKDLDDLGKSFLSETNELLPSRHKTTEK